MQELWSYIRDIPWLWVFLAVGSSVWIASVVVIFRSTKFFRKSLWLLLSLFSSKYLWSISNDATIGIGIPIGALYILWFWRFGRQATPEEIARREARSEANANSPFMLMFLRAVYFGAALAFGVSGYVAASGVRSYPAATMHQSNVHSSKFLFTSAEMVIFLSALSVALVLLMLFLSYRPYWWGKIICLWTGVSWIGYAMISPHPSSPLAPVVAFICGVFMVAAAVAHQIIDPRFSGAHLRSYGA
ncbi:MAG TPA: hypothetical protein VMD53_15375 [Rhizomicrobium sp.]|nr:hypothetical protein [Rhizomicrobium sp.]